MADAREEGLAICLRDRHVELEEVVAPIRDGLALRRIPTDADVANVVVFLCSSYSDGVTGQTIHIDGGMGDILH